MSDRIELFHFEGDKARLDKYLSAQLPEFSRSRLLGLILDSCVLINGIPAKKGGQVLSDGNLVTVNIPPVQSAGLLAEKIPLDVIFENDELIVINKPAGMVVHPAAGHENGTLVNAMLGHDPDIEGIGGEERPGVVHRLDKDTSGLIIMAKNERAHRWLQDQFRLRKVEKTYLALVDGRPPTPTGRVDAPIGRDPHQRKKMAVTTIAKGREAVSEYKTLESFLFHTLLEFHPHTGRTHQIRLHCAFLGCPITADPIYGRKKATVDLDRQFLHAFRLSITIPGEEKPRAFEAPIPPDLARVLEKLREH
ncbi:MAG: RluA family pseudouridine synthase [Chloroflexota bacterium]